MQRKFVLSAICSVILALLVSIVTVSPSLAQRPLPPANTLDEQLNLGERPTSADAQSTRATTATLVVNGACPDTSPADGICDDNPSQYKTIQAAINAALSGDTISVLAGNYFENIVVSKPLTLAGAGQASTFIFPAVSLPNPCSGSSMCGTITAASNIIVVQASDVVIHGFTLDGDNTALTSTIVVNGADLDARNGIIEDFYTGVYNNLEVYDTTVKNIYLRGIYVSTGGTGFNVHDNTVDNVDGESSSIALFNFGGSGQFANNTVTKANDAIAANHSRGTQFLNNAISNSASGIHTDNAGDGVGSSADLIQGFTTGHF